MSKSSLSSSARSRASSCSPELSCSAASIEADRAKEAEVGCSDPVGSAAGAPWSGSRPSGST